MGRLKQCLEEKMTTQPDPLQEAKDNIESFAPQSDNTLDNYNKRVVENVSMCADSDIPAEWTNILTGKKLYNQASVDIAIAEARIDELQQLSAIARDNLNYLVPRSELLDRIALAKSQRDKLRKDTSNG